jgi:hypothetical protein
VDDRHVRANDESRRRLLALIDRLGDDDLAADLGDGWTVAAALAHVACWDRSAAARWERWRADGSMAEFPAALIDIVNAANLPAWRALPPRVAADQVRSAAEELDARIAELPDEAVAFAQATDRWFLVDRTGHRLDHIRQIEEALGAG